MRRWAYDFEAATVIEVECAERGYPHTDEHGETQYENTHFDDEGAAWRKLIDEVEAAVSLGERARRQAREALERCTVELADGAERLVRAHSNRAARFGPRTETAKDGDR